MNTFNESGEKSAVIGTREEAEPPGSIFSEIGTNKQKHIEPAQNFGSFFVSEIVSDIDKCRQLWDEFSPQKTLFDTWEFRYAFYLAYGHKPYFILLKNGGENLGLLSLWYEEDKKQYFWFGSDWQEEVLFFCKDPKYIHTLLDLAPSPLYLNAISGDSIAGLEDKTDFKADLPKYILNLQNFKTGEDYLMTLKKNDRHSLRKDWRRIERQNPEITINKFSDISELVALAKKRFLTKGEETDWEDKRRIKTFEEVINLSGKSYEARMISIRINRQPAGVDLVCLFNNTYFAVKCGYDVSNFSGIGNFMNLFEIEDALKLGMKKIDFLQNNFEWKSRWFEPIPLFQYKK